MTQSEMSYLEICPGGVKIPGTSGQIHLQLHGSVLKPIKDKINSPPTSTGKLEEKLPCFKVPQDILLKSRLLILAYNNVSS